ncbi:MAG TPA: transporter associated domain-containing protein [Gammaproteobacteria bacterium]|jgi:magnesium and cobalt transporter|nr:transporter associated domain-containing protein [Gammaproteobacteria bacterium]
MSDDTHPSGDTGVSGWWQRLVQGRAGEVKSREDIVEFLEGFLERGIVGEDEFAMLQGVLEVADTQVRDIMIPRSQMVVVSKDQTGEEVLKIITESNHSRFPVIGDDRDEVVGIVLAKDVLKHFIVNKEPFDIQNFLRPAGFIPESKRLNTLLTEFREGRNHMAVVVDEYGGVSGLATIEDVLEQIVGDIDDELDPEEASSIQPQDGGKYSVMALTRIDEFNEFFNTELSDADYDTVGGLVMHELGRLPRRGEQLDFAGLRFKVLRGDRRRLHTLEVTRLPVAAAE